MLCIVEEKNVGTRLDVYLSGIMDNYTRSYIKKLIDEGNILVNNKNVKSGYSLKVNDGQTVLIA